MDWNDVRYFLALARLGSVRSAGADLGVSHSTVARRVEALERRLSARLFDRNRDGYVLTDAGRDMLPGAERVEREMSALERDLVGRDERLEGPVALTCCDAYVSGILVRELSAFCLEYPDIEMCMTTDSRPFDLSKREADIAVRTLAAGAQPPEHLIGRRLAPVVVANYIGVDHQKRLDPEQPGSTPRWLGIEERRFHLGMVARSSYPSAPIWGTFSSLPLLVQATREGMGISMLPTYVGDSEASLRRLAKPDLKHLADLWLLSHVDLRDNARFRATRRQVVEAMSRHLPLFSGDRGSPMHPCVPKSHQGEPAAGT